MSQLPLNYDPPRVKGSDTSVAAADSMAAETSRRRGLVLEAIRQRGAHGATDDELEVELHLRHQTASARRRELVLLGKVRDSGWRRATRSGRKASVWIVI